MALTEKTKAWIQKNADVDLTGKNVLITGANSGIGFKTVEAMAYLSASVVMVCRCDDPENPVRSYGAESMLADMKENGNFLQPDIQRARKHYDACFPEWSRAQNSITGKSRTGRMKNEKEYKPPLF